MEFDYQNWFITNNKIFKDYGINLKSKKKGMKQKKKPLIILCFGGFDVFTNYQCTCCVKWRTAKANELFAYFIHNIKKPLPLNKIITDVWPETAPDKASDLFHTNLSYIRHFLKTIGGNRTITYYNRAYSIFLEFTFCDFITFNEFIKYPLSSPDKQVIQLLQYSVSFYRGEYMGETSFEWCLEFKEYYLNLNTQTLLFLSEYYMDRKEYQIALHYLRELIQWNPLLENVHVMIMRALSQTGDKLAIMKQYNTLCNILMEYIGIHPQSETKKLFYELLK
jgi:two-component system LytT family response regulator